MGGGGGWRRRRRTPLAHVKHSRVAFHDFTMSAT